MCFNRYYLFFFFVTVPVMLINCVRLILFVFCLLPGFIQFAYYYWFVADRIIIKYGTESQRQTLDVYTIRNRLNHRHDDGDLDDDILNNDSSITRGRLLPTTTPVVVFIPGGGWLIGYKMWGALTARVLNACGIIVLVPDYRNYPWTTVPGMVHDISVVLQWTKDNITSYGGNASNIVVVGQSAGGHLLVTALIRQALGFNNYVLTNSNINTNRSPSFSHLYEDSCIDRQHVNNNDDTLDEPFMNAAEQSQRQPWKATDFKGLITLSAPFDLNAMVGSFRKHGLDQHIVDRIFGHDISLYDPRVLLETNNTNRLLALPPMLVYHGDADQTVPSCDEFYLLLQQRLSNTCTCTVYPGWSHTDAIIEGPMIANHTFHRDVFEAVKLWTSTTSSSNDVDSAANGTDEQAPSSSSQLDTNTKPLLNLVHTQLEWPDSTHPALRPLCPSVLAQLGRFFMPF